MVPQYTCGWPCHLKGKYGPSFVLVAENVLILRLTSLQQVSRLWASQRGHGQGRGGFPPLSPALTSAVLQDRLHGTLPVRGPANAGRAGYLVFSGPPALPEVHLMMVVNKEESCEVRAERGHEGLLHCSAEALPLCQLCPQSSRQGSD